MHSPVLNRRAMLSLPVCIGGSPCRANRPHFSLVRRAIGATVVAHLRFYEPDRPAQHAGGPGASRQEHRGELPEAAPMLCTRNSDRTRIRRTSMVPLLREL